jgi:hypothetical protein
VPTLADARDSAERRAIVRRAGGDRRRRDRAAEWLQVSRSTLFEKLRRLGLRAESKADRSGIPDGIFGRRVRKAGLARRGGRQNQCVGLAARRAPWHRVA